jgi:hypothetical protein
MTEAQLNAMYFDHITRDWDLVHSHARHLEAFGKRARQRGHLFILGDASL